MVIFQFKQVYTNNNRSKTQFYFNIFKSDSRLLTCYINVSFLMLKSQCSKYEIRLNAYFRFSLKNCDRSNTYVAIETGICTA